MTFIIVLAVISLGFSIITGVISLLEMTDSGVTPLSKFTVSLCFVCLAIFVIACATGALLTYLPC